MPVSVSMEPLSPSIDIISTSRPASSPSTVKPGHHHRHRLLTPPPHLQHQGAHLCIAVCPQPRVAGRRPGRMAHWVRPHSPSWLPAMDRPIAWRASWESKVESGMCDPVHVAWRLWLSRQRARVVFHHMRYMPLYIRALGDGKACCLGVDTFLPEPSKSRQLARQTPFLTCALHPTRCRH